MSRIIIFANGELSNIDQARSLIQTGDFIVAADGGTRHVLVLGLIPDVIIGDLDSLPLNFEPALQTKIIKHSRDKNETDLELAVQYAVSQNPHQIIIVAALGGRLDQTIANIALLSNFPLSTICLDDGVEQILFCWNQVKINGRSGDIISLIPWGNPVTGIQTENLKWALDNETLFPEKTRGISNEMTADEASISIASGLLLIVHTRSIR